MIRVNAMIPRISSMIAAPRMALPALVESLPSSFRVSTVIETDVAVSTTPMKRCCRNGEQASLSPLPTPIAAASPSPPNSGTITPRRAIMNDALPVFLSSLTSVVSPAVNISTITPISDSSEMNSVSFTTLRTAGPSITPANNAPTTCGSFIFFVTSPRILVESSISAINNM